MGIHLYRHQSKGAMPSAQLATHNIVATQSQRQHIPTHMHVTAADIRQTSCTEQSLPNTCDTSIPLCIVKANV